MKFAYELLYNAQELQVHSEKWHNQILKLIELSRFVTCYLETQIPNELRIKEVAKIYRATMGFIQFTEFRLRTDPMYHQDSEREKRIYSAIERVRANLTINYTALLE